MYFGGSNLSQVITLPLDFEFGELAAHCIDVYDENLGYGKVKIGELWTIISGCVLHLKVRPCLFYRV